MPVQYLESDFQDAISEVKGGDNPESLTIAVITPDGRPLAEKLDMNKTIPVSLQAAPPYMDLF